MSYKKITLKQTEIPLCASEPEYLVQCFPACSNIIMSVFEVTGM